MSPGEKMIFGLLLFGLAGGHMNRIIRNNRQGAIQGVWTLIDLWFLLVSTVLFIYGLGEVILDA
jgi:hypothetical protein